MSHVADLKVVLCRKPGRSSAQSEVMMARLLPGGLFELLSAAAWSRALGYSPEELDEKSLCELLAMESAAAPAVVAALLDRARAEPLDVMLLCKDERRRCFRFHRRFDPHAQSIFFVADEVAVARG